ncbi:hypothetical protein [Kitasatospora sp. NPDC002040]|uniref:hypothetical protein n=1 Tax=Kitasatospora sp. NPDC002040 TaxID=3154661 RepID=UPI003330F6A5
MTNGTTRPAGGVRPTALQLPRLAPPVDRSTAAAGALGSASGIEADGLFDLIKSVLPSVLPGGLPGGLPNPFGILGGLLGH